MNQYIGTAQWGNPILVAGTDGINMQTLHTDANGNLYTTPGVGTSNTVQLTDGTVTTQKAAVDAAGNLAVRFASAQPVSLSAALPAGTNVIGTVTNQQGTQSALNLTASTLVKATPGRAVRVSVIVAGTTAGSVNDSTTVAGILTANNVFVIPNTVGSYLIDWPMMAGIVVVPGLGQTVALSYA